MPYTEWQPGVNPPSPVYLDSSVLVASLITNDRCYVKTTTLLAELLASNISLVVSALTVSESLWILAKVSYREVFNHPEKVRFSPEIFERNAEAIFAKFGHRMSSIYDLIRDWRQAGVDISLLPNDMNSFQRATENAPTYMRMFKLASADAMHLATAELEAKSLVTGDSDFQRARSAALTIFHVSP
jgi:predicted nucleic acid-binding protein